MRSYSEEQIYIIVYSIGNDTVIYKIRTECNLKGKSRTVHHNMLMHCDNLLDNFDPNIREPVSQKHPVQGRADRKTRKTNEKIQDQSQEYQLTSSGSDNEDINFTPKQLRFLEGMGRGKKKETKQQKQLFKQ